MNVLFSTMQFGRGYGQGTERYLTMLADGLTGRGHRVTILAGDPERRGPQLPLGELVEAPPRTLSYPTGGRWTVEGLPPDELRPLLEREQPDVLHVANPAHIGVGLVRAARRAKIPVVVTVMDYWWLCPKHTLLHQRGEICDARVPWSECLSCTSADDQRAWVRALAGTPGVRTALLPILAFGKALSRGVPAAELRRWTRRQAFLGAVLNDVDAVIFVSGGARRRLSPRLPSPRLYSIAFGMEARWFAAQRAAVDTRGPLDPEALVIGFAGALGRHKGVHLLLEAVQRLGWCRTAVRIAGGAADAIYRARLARLAAGLNVEFLGPVPSVAMPEFLRSLDVLVVPSLWPENQPLAVLEALATNTPVLASRVDGISEVIADGSRLFDVNSAPSLAACLEAWTRAPQHAATTAAVSTVDEMLAQTLAVYAAVCRRA